MVCWLGARRVLWLLKSSSYSSSRLCYPGQGSGVRKFSRNQFEDDLTAPWSFGYWRVRKTDLFRLRAEAGKSGHGDGDQAANYRHGNAVVASKVIR
jgi:hypothetical protein